MGYLRELHGRWSEPTVYRSSLLRRFSLRVGIESYHYHLSDGDDGGRNVKIELGPRFLRRCRHSPGL